MKNISSEKELIDYLHSRERIRSSLRNFNTDSLNNVSTIPSISSSMQGSLTSTNANISSYTENVTSEIESINKEDIFKNMTEENKKKIEQEKLKTDRDIIKLKMDYEQDMILTNNRNIEHIQHLYKKYLEELNIKLNHYVNLKAKYDNDKDLYPKELNDNERIYIELREQYERMKIEYYPKINELTNFLNAYDRIIEENVKEQERIKKEIINLENKLNDKNLLYKNEEYLQYNINNNNVIYIELKSNARIINKHKIIAYEKYKFYDEQLYDIKIHLLTLHKNIEILRDIPGKINRIKGNINNINQLYETTLLSFEKQKMEAEENIKKLQIEEKELEKLIK